MFVSLPFLPICLPCCPKHRNSPLSKQTAIHCIFEVFLVVVVITRSVISSAAMLIQASSVSMIPASLSIVHFSCNRRCLEEIPEPVPFGTLALSVEITIR